MYGVGKQTAQKLKSMGIETIGDLALCSRERLAKKLGKAGAEIHLLANGIDPSPVMPHSQDAMKSIGRSVTLSEDISDIEYAKTVLLRLSEEVGSTARKYGKKGRTVQINIKYADFKNITRQTTVYPTYQTKEIYSTGMDLLQKNWNKELPVRLLGISLSGFSEDFSTEQLSMFNMPVSGLAVDTSEKLDRLENTIDEIREKYGTSIINRAVLMNKKKKGGKQPG